MSDLLEQDLREAERCHAAGDIPRAIALYRAILDIHPYFSHTAFNLANILKDQQNYEEAELFFRQALTTEPELSAAALNLAFVLQEQGRYDEAIAINSQLAVEHPDLSDAIFNLACLQLLTGHYSAGWRGYEQRFHTQRPVPERHTSVPLWSGEQRSGLRLLVHTEQGFGDSLQMCRYLPILADAGLQIWLETTSELAPLLRRLSGLSGCILRGEPLPDVDYRAPIMSLPGLMGTTAVTIPPPVIAVDKTLRQRMAVLLPDTGKLRVGLCWAGRLDLPANRKRTCPPSFFKTILDTPGICAVSLQTGHPDELALVDDRLVDLSGIFADFHHTAALIANLDLVITIDSAVAHLAATVGTPTWLLLPHVPDWRWFLQRSDSPWYPAMRLFRQPERSDWTSVLQEVTSNLAELLTASAAELINRGAVLDHQGACIEALLCYQQAIDRAGFSDIVCYNMGNTLMNLGRPEQAEHAYRQALQLNPGIAEAHHNLARIFKERGEFAKAYEQLESALKLRPRFPDALHTLGELFLAEERFTDAISSLRTALLDAPEETRIWNTLGIVYQCAERDVEAKECYEKALEYNPDYLHALNNLGAVCLSLGEPLEGVRHLHRLVQLNPEYADGHWNLAGCLLAAGLYPEGWREYEWRWQKNNPIEARHQQVPRWNGSSLAGQRILIWAEQGFGDTIQFIRYIPQVKACGGTIILECQTEAIRALCEGVDGIAQVIVRGEQLPTVDVQAPLLSLPGIFGTTLATIPATVPYLHPDAARKQRWQQLVEPDKGIHIGLVWGGRQTLRNRRRSSQLADFAPLANLPGAIFYSLQVGEQANEAASPPPGMVLYDHTAQIRDFADTAALIDCLDMVITIDTSVAHLAGALGKPTWILLPTAVDWRWLLDRSDSPWYPSATLLRQSEAGNWQTVMTTLAEELTARIQSRPIASAAEQMAAGDRCRDNEEWQEAVSCYRSALELDPSHPHAHLRLGGSLLFLNRHEEAIDYLRQAVQLTPDDPAPHITLALACLATGRQQEGWREFEWRRKNISEPLPDIPELPQLNSGQRLDGITVLIHSEQGFGDTIQMARYLPYLTATGATIIFSAPPELAELLRSVASNVQVIPHGEPLPAAHFQTLLMSLPYLLAQVAPAIPATVPYLAPSAELVEQWRQRLEPLPGLKIGIAWQGRDMGKSGYRRALTLAQLAPLFAITGTSFVTLQPGCLDGLSPEWHNLYDQSPHIHNFSDTAALIANLDLVISVDTAVAHLAGALGRPCWVALLYAPDWRWCPLDSSASCWYPHTSSYRQPTPGEWQPVIKQLADHLQEETLVWHGHQAGEQGHLQEAIKSFWAAAQLPTAACSTWLNLGIYLHSAGLTVEGLDALDHAIAIKPDYAEAWQNKGLLHQTRGDTVEAFTCFRRALAIRPDYPVARWNIALLQLLLGDFSEGFKNFEFRSRKPDAPPQRHSDIPRWHGEDISGKTLLIHAEQGYGDTIQFLRYAPLLAERRITIILEVQDSALVNLASAIPGIHTVITRSEHRPAVDFQIPILSLPHVCNTTSTTIPSAPYCLAEATKVAWWRQLTTPGSFKVGIAWAGNRNHHNNANRSIPFDLFRTILQDNGIAWYSLQIGPDGLKHITLPELAVPLNDLTDHIHDFSDSAALIANLDLVITVDTSTAHLAGALGKPVWVLLPYAPDWRWILGRNDTPWYPTMTLFRQHRPGDWHTVLAEVITKLSDIMADQS